MSEKKQKKSAGPIIGVAEDLGNALAVAFIALASAVIPLFLKNGYISLTRTKTDAFILPAFGMLPVALLVFLLYFKNRAWQGKAALYFIPWIGFTGFGLVLNSNIITLSFAAVMAACYIKKIKEAPKTA